MKKLLKISLFVLTVAGIGVFLVFNPSAVGRALAAYQQLVAPSEEMTKGKPDALRPIKPQGKWDGVLELSDRQQQTIGLRTVIAREQTEATVLKLPGMTAYDPATLTIVRTQFDSRVDKVLVDLGSVIKKGDPILELFSNSLAEAKSTFETASNQWGRDKKVLDYKKPLAESNALPRKELIEIENDEAQSRLAMKLAMDKLLVYGLTEKEIEDAKSEDGVKKARMTLRSVADGMVVRREVVPGNFYDPKDDLLTIAPLDRLWIRSNISEIDADQVQVGQTLRVVFPYSHNTIPGKVEYIDKAIDPESRSAKFRTSILNPERQFKAGAFVRVQLDLPSVNGRTVIPRVAMISVDRYDYVFVKKPGHPARFARQSIALEREGNEQIIVAEPTSSVPGLKPGDEIVTSGSLILEQMYEDRMMIEGGPLN
jgi:membrane fusion protein, heavy metal efflux system